MDLEHGFPARRHKNDVAAYLPSDFAFHQKMRGRLPTRAVPENRATLADRYILTVYDASYLDLALRKGLSLATQGEALLAAAIKVGVGIAKLR
jgi:hypothetical protein